MRREKEMKRRIDDAFAFVDRVVKRPDRYPDQAILFLLDPAEIASAVTKERLRLLRELSARDYPSIFELARQLGRDVSRVRKDLLALERLDLVTFAKYGNRIRVRPSATGIYIPLLPPKRARAASRMS